jgi:hypothetical protein
MTETTARQDIPAVATRVLWTIAVVGDQMLDAIGVTEAVLLEQTRRVDSLRCPDAGAPDRF